MKCFVNKYLKSTSGNKAQQMIIISTIQEWKKAEWEMVSGNNGRKKQRGKD